MAAAAPRIEYVFVLQKPDSVDPGRKAGENPVYIGAEIVNLFNLCGFTQVAFRAHGSSTPGLIPKFREHYGEHSKKDFYDELVLEMAKGPVWSYIFSRPADHPDHQTATEAARAICGVIRARFAQSRRKNTIHVSDSPDAAKREIEIWHGAGTYASLVDSFS